MASSNRSSISTLNCATSLSSQRPSFNFLNPTNREALKVVIDSQNNRGVSQSLSSCVKRLFSIALKKKKEVRVLYRAICYGLKGGILRVVDAGSVKEEAMSQDLTMRQWSEAGWRRGSHISFGKSGSTVKLEAA